MRKIILGIVVLALVLCLLPLTAKAETWDCWALGDYGWGAIRIGAPEVHSQGITGQAIKLAIIDTGVDYTHPELAAIYKGGYDFVNRDSDPMDQHGHGTHCAGIACAAIYDNSGVGGIAPNVELYAVRVLNLYGMGTYDWIIQGVDWCIAHEIDVMSLSLGGTTPTPELEAAFQRAWDAGIVSVAAAGNSGGNATTDKMVFPARFGTVIAVAALDSSDYKASFSSTGPGVEVSAPGVSVYSCILGGTYGYKSGTSMACPHVAGAVALIESVHPDWSNADVRGQIRGTADDLGPIGHDWMTGFGIIDLQEAVGPLVNYPAMPPLPPPNFPPHSITLPPSNVGSTTATMHGQLTDMGNSEWVYVRFLYYEPPSGTITYGTPGQYLYSPGLFSEGVSNLKPSTTYAYTVYSRGSNGSFSVDSGFDGFTTLPPEEPPPPPPPPPEPVPITATFDAYQAASRTLGVAIQVFSMDTKEPIANCYVVVTARFSRWTKTLSGYTNSQGKLVLTQRMNKDGLWTINVRISKAGCLPIQPDSQTVQIRR